MLMGTAWKVSKYEVFSGPYFSVFLLNTETYEVKLHIKSEYRKMRTRKNSVFGHFLRSGELSAGFWDSISLIRNKLDILRRQVKELIDILIVSKIKFDKSLPYFQFLIDCLQAPFQKSDNEKTRAVS